MCFSSGVEIFLKNPFKVFFFLAPKVALLKTAQRTSAIGSKKNRLIGIRFEMNILGFSKLAKRPEKAKAPNNNDPESPKYTSLCLLLTYSIPNIMVATSIPPSSCENKTKEIAGKSPLIPSIKLNPLTMVNPKISSKIAFGKVVSIPERKNTNIATW